MSQKNRTRWKRQQGGFVSIIFLLSGLVFFLAMVCGAKECDSLIAWWKFEETGDRVLYDSISGISDEIRGNFRFVRGVSGTAVKFDGHTTVIVRKAAFSPVLSDAFTIEAWIAIAAYPWNWCAVLNHRREQEAGYSLEVGPRGELGLKIFAGSEWRECISEIKIPLRKWNHIAGTYDKNKGASVYIDGKLAGELFFTGEMNKADNIDLFIGTNRTKQKPAFIHREYGTLPAWYSLDAVLDEVRIYNQALSHKDIEQHYNSQRPSLLPDIPPRVLPSGPPGKGRFGAYYTKLKYYWEWDDLWRIADHPDVVVQFDDSLVKVVFWRGTRYSPAWVSENGLWMADQSVEAWDNIEGCFEHMQDARCLYSHVRIIENTEARVIVHWRYAPVSAHNHLWRVDEKTGWACWVDEYYYFYPDQTGIRKVMWQKDSLGKVRQFQESIPLAHPGQLQGDVINPDYVTVANLKGEKQVFSYIKNPPQKTTKWVPENPTIQMHNLKSKNKPFIIFEPGSKMGYLRDMNIDALSRPGSCNHWPEGLVPCDGRTSIAADRATSFLGFPITYPVVHEGPESRNLIYSLYGMTEKPIEEVIALAKSWCLAPALRVIHGNVSNEGYDMSQRAYVLRCKECGEPTDGKFLIEGNADSPVVNTCLIVKCWGEQGAEVFLNGKRLLKGEGFRLGHERTLERTNLVIWVEQKSVEPLWIEIRPAE